MQLYTVCVCLHWLRAAFQNLLDYLQMLGAINKELSKPLWWRISIGGTRDKVDPVRPERGTYRTPMKPRAPGTTVVLLLL